MIKNSQNTLAIIISFLSSLRNRETRGSKSTLKDPFCTLKILLCLHRIKLVKHLV
jgi:hypothetical protein